jgi:hypothetical protein
MTVKLRPYKNKDVISVFKILTQLKGTNLSKIMVSTPIVNSTKEDDAEPDYERVGSLVVDVLFECLDKCGDSLVAWLADLNGMTKEDYLESDESIIDTIDAIVKNPESKSFFSKVSLFFKTVKP